MLTINCPGCGNTMNLSSTEGTFVCKSCSHSIPVTELDLPQLGSRSKSVYYPEKAADNINTSDIRPASGSHSDKKTHSEIPQIIPSRISEEEAVSAYKKWAKNGLFSPGYFYKKNKSTGPELKYVPAMLYTFTGHGSIEMTGNKIDETVNSKERRITTDYYGIRRLIDIECDNYVRFSDENIPGSYIMNMLNDYSFDDMKDADDPSGTGRTCDSMTTGTPDMNSPDSDSYRLPDDVIEFILNETEKELEESVTGYSSTYTEEINTGYSINSKTPILVPVWMKTHDKASSANNFYMNGQTGTIYGRPVISRLKTALMITLLCVILSLIGSFAVYSISSAETDYNIVINDVEPVISDTADILSEYDEISIRDYANSQKEETGFQYIILTVDSSSYEDKEYELQKIYGRLKDSISAPGIVLFLMGTDGDSLECALQGYKEAKDRLPREICDSIEAELEQTADIGAPSQTMTALFDTLELVNNGTYVPTEPEKKSSNIVQLIILVILISAALSVILVAFLVLSKNRASTRKTDSGNIQFTVRVREQKDIYIRSSETVYKLK